MGHAAFMEEFQIMAGGKSARSLSWGLAILALLSLSCVQAADGPGGRGGLPKPPSYGSAGNAAGDSLMEYFHALGAIKRHAGELEKKLAVGRPSTNPRHPSDPPDLESMLHSIRQDAEYLQQKWLEWPQRHPGQTPYPMNVKLDPYMRSLEGSAKQLRSALKTGAETGPSLIKAVAADMKAKAGNCRGSADGLGRDIAVKVRTLRGTEEVAGYKVWCAPMALVDFKNEHIRFPKVSSPSEHKKLPPGYYAVWLEKSGEKSKPEGHTIGGKGQTEFELDLTVPEQLN